MKEIVRLVQKQRTKNKAVKGLTIRAQLNTISNVRVRVD